MNKHLTIGTRGSDLALWQAHFLQVELQKLGVESSLEIIKTQGDKIQHLGFDKMEGKGFFTKEIEAALLSKKVDVAVHSHKDLETTPPPGLIIAAVPERGVVEELILIRKEAVDTTQHFYVKKEAVVGTSAARRKAQVHSIRPDVELKDLRGNVPTRIQKLRDGQYDAILMAKAGVSRLGIDLSEFEVVELDPREFIPAPAQGALAFQCREDDVETESILRKLNNQEVTETTAIERGILSSFDGGCHMPLGAYCKKEGNTFKVWATMAAEWEKPVSRSYLEGTNPTELIEETIQQLTSKKKSRS